jgi:nuclear transport factor 2 (NTF2) superfamily protein
MNPPLPPFTVETAAEKARRAEDAWNTRDPARVVLAYTSDSRWRNRAEFLEGRDAIKAFLTRKWQRELDYRLIKEVWAFRENRIAVRFAYEWHDDSGNWFRILPLCASARRNQASALTSSVLSQTIESCIDANMILSRHDEEARAFVLRARDRPASTTR